MRGFSLTNIKYMVQFAKEYPDFLISQQLVGRIPWGHNILLLQKIDNVEERLWYANKVIENGWSRSTLLHFLENNFYKQRSLIDNCQKTFFSSYSDLPKQSLKDLYCFDFLTREKEYQGQGFD